MDKPRIFDQQGGERDWGWLEANFGAIRLDRAEIPPGVRQVYRVVKLQESEGPAVQLVNVTDQDGNPIEGLRVVRHWPGAPSLPAWAAPISMWREQGVYGETNANGEIGFGMGRGDYYFAPSGGASGVWIAGETGPSDLVSGLGMLGATNHRALVVYYQLLEVEGPPAPPPPAPSPAPSPPPAPAPVPVAPSAGFDIVDKNGRAQDLAWLEHFFGTVEHNKAPEPDAFRLIELCEVVGVHEAKIKVLDERGNPKAGVPISFRRWDGGGGLTETTGNDGVARFSLESGAKYPVPGKGPFLALVKKEAGNSDAVIGLGRVLGTPRHLDVTFQYRTGEQPTPSPAPDPLPSSPPENWWQQVFDKLDTIIALLEERAR